MLNSKTKFYIYLSGSIIFYGFALMIIFPIMSGNDEIFEPIEYQSCVKEGIVTQTCDEYETKYFGGFDLPILLFGIIMHLVFGTLFLSNAKGHYNKMKNGVTTAN